MARLASSIDPRSADFAANGTAMRALVTELKETLAKNARGGTEAARKKHRAETMTARFS